MEADDLSPLKDLIDHQWRAHGRATPVDGLLLTSVTAATGPIHAVYRPSLCVVVQGAKNSMLAANQRAIVPAQRPVAA